MKKTIKKVLLLITMSLSFSTTAFSQTEKWEIVDAVDKFGDKTAGKNLIYVTEAIFSNTATTGDKARIIIRIKSPNLIDVNAYDYGEYINELNKARFSYKSIFIGSVDNVPSVYGFVDKKGKLDDTLSMISLLKMAFGNSVKVVVEKDKAIYRFEINSTDFDKLLKEAFGK